MNRLIPVPSQESMPGEIAEGLAPLAAKLDVQFDAWVDEAFGLERLKDPARMPPQLLEEAGYQLAAGFSSGDDDRVKRAKVHSAVLRNIQRGLWELSVKPAVEARSGATAALFDAYGLDDFILVGVSGFESELWAALGGSGSDASYGIRLAGGASDVPETTPGVVLIDVGTSTMTAGEVAALVYDLLDLVPAYFQTYLGYVSSGAFVAYANGRIN